MRKEMDLKVDSFVDVNIVTSTAEDAPSLNSRQAYILNEVRAKKLTIQHLDQAKARGQLVREWSIGDHTFSIGLTRRKQLRETSSSRKSKR